MQLNITLFPAVFLTVDNFAVYFQPFNVASLSAITYNCNMVLLFQRRNISSNGRRRMNNRTSMAQREEVIRRTVYVSDIDQQVRSPLVVFWSVSFLRSTVLGIWIVFLRFDHCHLIIISHL